MKYLVKVDVAWYVHNYVVDKEQLEADLVDIDSWIEKGYIEEYKEKKPEKEEPNLDLDGDGDIDGDDRSIAAGFLGSKKGRKKKK